jgi:hypothetical protein
MSDTKINQCNDLVTRLAAADGTTAGEHSPAIPNTEISREVLAAIVGGVPIYFTLRIGGAEAAGFFKEATGFDSESEVTER